MDSILNSIKKLLGPTEEQTHFDPDIIMHINSVFSRLHQLGVGPSEGFHIEDDISRWTDFLPRASFEKMHMVKTYMYLKVKLLFDPPLNASVLTSIKELIQEYEFELSVAAEESKQ